MLSFMEKKASAVKLAEWSPSDWPESLPEMRVIWYKYLHHCVQKCSWLDKFHFFLLFFRRSTIYLDVLFATNSLMSR